jgi:hypothetical protein
MIAPTLFPTNRRRVGKIARLPDEVRDSVNKMLDDGFPYGVILVRLGDHAKGMNYHSLKRWYRGGYQDYLKSIRDEQSADLRRQFTKAVLDRDGVNGLPGAVAAQAFGLALDLDYETVSRGILKDATTFTRFVNSLVAMAGASVSIEKCRIKQKPSAPSSNKPHK